MRLGFSHVLCVSRDVTSGRRERVCGVTGARILEFRNTVCDWLVGVHVVCLCFASAAFVAKSDCGTYRIQGPSTRGVRACVCVCACVCVPVSHSGQ